MNAPDYSCAVHFFKSSSNYGVIIKLSIFTPFGLGKIDLQLFCNINHANTWLSSYDPTDNQFCVSKYAPISETLLLHTFLSSRHIPNLD